VPLEVFVADEQSQRPVDCQRWAAFAEAVLRAEKVRGDAELSVLFVDEATITAHAERFLGHDGPTDVLAFPIEDDPVPSGRSPDSGGNGPGWEPPEPDGMPLLLGDVVICPEVAWRNAPRHAGSYEDELALLLVHGILHLLGMDHELAEEETAMQAREQELLDAHYRQPPTRSTKSATAGSDVAEALAGGGQALAGSGETPRPGGDDRGGGSAP
jgi:probable rRNA maturation factor